jgi:hypothetical protein
MSNPISAIERPALFPMRVVECASFQREAPVARANWMVVGMAQSAGPGARLELVGSGGEPYSFATSITCVPRDTWASVARAHGAASSTRDMVLIGFGGKCSSHQARVQVLDALDAVVSELLDPDALKEEPFQCAVSTLEMLNRLLRSGALEWAEGEAKVPKKSVFGAVAAKMAALDGLASASFGETVVGCALSALSSVLERAASSPRRGTEALREVVLHAAVAVVASLTEAVKQLVVNDKLFLMLDRWLGVFAPRYALSFGRGGSFSAMDGHLMKMATAQQSKAPKEPTVVIDHVAAMLHPFCSRHASLDVLGKWVPEARMALSPSGSTRESSCAVEDFEDFDVAGVASTEMLAAWLLAAGYEPSAKSPLHDDEENGEPSGGDPSSSSARDMFGRGPSMFDGGSASAVPLGEEEEEEEEDVPSGGRSEDPYMHFGGDNDDMAESFMRAMMGGGMRPPHAMEEEDDDEEEEGGDMPLPPEMMAFLMSQAMSGGGGASGGFDEMMLAAMMGGGPDGMSEMFMDMMAGDDDEDEDEDGGHSRKPRGGSRPPKSKKKGAKSKKHKPKRG